MKIVVALLTALLSMSAFAADAAAPALGNSFGPIIFLALIVVFMYFMVWRPQQKKAKEHRALVAGVSKGDEVMTNAGIVGKVANVYDQYLDLEVSAGVSITLQKGAVASVLPKGTLDSLKK